MRIGVAGSLNSSDTLITVKPSKETVIEIESTVMEFFGPLIKETINETLIKIATEPLHVKCIDKGALDFTLIARLKTAIERMNNHA